MVLVKLIKKLFGCLLLSEGQPYDHLRLGVNGGWEYYYD